MNPEEPRPHAPEPDPPRGGLSAVLQEDQFSLRDAIGGPRGAIESILPTLLFVVLFVATKDVTIAAVSAVVVVVIALIARLVARQSPSSVLGGLLGVAIGAIWALRSGDGGDFYAPGIAINAVSLVILLISVIAGRPLIGLLVSLLDPRVANWREDPDARGVYTRATLVFCGLYAAKLLVQVPLLISGAVAALGVAKLVMGLPLFALVAWVVWMMHRSLLARREARDATQERDASGGPSPAAVADQWRGGSSTEDS